MVLLNHITKRRDIRPPVCQPLHIVVPDGAEIWVSWHRRGWKDISTGTSRIGAQCVLAKWQGNYAHAHYARYTPFMSQRLTAQSLAYRARKLRDVSSRPVYSGLMNSRVLPTVWFGFEIGFDGFLLSQNTNFFFGTLIETTFRLAAQCLNQLCQCMTLLNTKYKIIIQIYQHKNKTTINHSVPYIIKYLQWLDNALIRDKNSSIE